MAKPKQTAKGIVVETAGTVIHLRKKPKGTAKLSVKKRSRCISTDQASEARGGNLVFIIKAWRIGQKNKLNNCLKRQYLQPSKPQSSMRFSLLLAIKKPNLPDYPCGSRNSLLFGLESGVGAFPRTRANHCWPCSQSQMVLQWRLRCICLFMVSLGSLCSFRRQDRHLFGGRQ